ncbi:MAG: hypothetical protein KDA41_10985, partial [Planctomycetales bacterium]|nr:hypothetical protein [Planctomycetales bacterium]
RRLQLERVLIPRATIHEIMSRVAVVLRSAGETLEKKHGPEARATLDEALDDAERELAALADPADGQHPID